MQGCKKDNQYSCNQEINDWVTKYKNSLANLTREQLAMLPVQYQKATYGSFTKEKKAEIWKQKLILVKQQNLGNQMQLKIDELYYFIQPENFRNSIYEKPNDNVIEFLNLWEHHVLNDVKLDSVEFFINFCTIMTNDEIDKLLNNPQSIDYSWLAGGDDISLEPIGGSGNCTCYYNFYCSMFFNNRCTPGLNNCTVNWNCGLMGDSKCIGQCEENVTPGT